MVDGDSGRSKFVRWVVGKPRIWVGVVWCCIGLIWILLAVLDGSTVVRLLIGGGWLALGTLQAVVALRDRKNGRGFYQRTVSAPIAETKSGR